MAAWRSLRLLTIRNLKVRYSTSLLGYLWSVLDPLLMSLIYWFIFTQLMHRSLGEDPYIVFLLCAMLPWMWFNGAVSDSTVAFRRDAKLVRSVSLPRWIWVARFVCAKGIEYLLSLPVLALFALLSPGTQVNWMLLLYPLGILLMGVLILGVGLIIAPLAVFFRDFERATRIVLRVLFYASPVIYGLSDLPGTVFQQIAAFNPLSGIFSLYRTGFFPEQFDALAVIVSAILSVAALVLGVFVFRRLEPTVLKEL